MSRRLHTPPTRLVAEIPRPSTGEVIRVALLGAQPTHCDMRVFGSTRFSKGEPRPSKAGLTLRLDQLDEMIRALVAAKEACR